MKKALISVMVLGLSFSAYAAEKKKSEGQSSIKMQDVTQDKNKVSGDLDQEITNAKMRAESGSKSKFSLSVGLQYKGGQISQPFGQKRPNIVGQPGQEALTSGSVDPTVRYRWTKSDSVTLGNSFAIMTPFHKQTPAKKRFNFRDPALDYNHTAKIGSLQTSTDAVLALGTSNESKNIDQKSSWGLSYTALHSFQNGLTLGLSAAVDYQIYASKAGTHFQDNPNMQDPTDRSLVGYGNDDRNLWDLGLYPFAEYSFNDTYSFRTVFGYFNWQHLYGDRNNFRLLQTYVYQSIGVGISVTRDIYLYPNIQVVPGKTRWNGDFTNVAMSATMNVF